MNRGNIMGKANLLAIMVMYMKVLSGNNDCEFCSYCNSLSLFEFIWNTNKWSIIALYVLHDTWLCFEFITHLIEGIAFRNGKFHGYGVYVFQKKKGIS